VLCVGLFATTILTCEMIYYVYNYLYPYWKTLQYPQNIIYGVIYCYMCLMQYTSVMGIGALFFMHLRFSMINSTTIENTGRNSKGPRRFSFGVLYNMKSYFHSYWTCLLPVQPQYKYEGFYFPVIGEDPEINGIPLKFESHYTELNIKTLDELTNMTEAQITALLTN